MTLLVLAYVDPGSGLLIWQLVLSAVAGFIFSLKKLRAFLGHRIQKFVGRAAAPLPSREIVNPEEQKIKRR